MSDDVKKAVEWLRTLDIDDRDYGDAQTLLAHIDGEPARLAAARTAGADQAWDEAVKVTELEQAHVRLRAVAAAREEQREACARQFDLARRAERPMSKREAYERVRATPLDSTPLAERVAELEKERDEIARIAQEWRDERDRAERERDALKARLVEATDDGSLSARIGAVREALGMSEFDSAAEVGPINDLKAQLDEARALNAELVEALGHLEGACAAVASWSEDCLDYGDERRVAARAVLAKAEKVRST